MPRCPSSLCLSLVSIAFAGAGMAAVVSAQDFRVATIVSQRDAADSRWKQVTSSITLFHAGKVYDYMEEVREVVIFDPVQDRFVILSFNGNNLATTLQFPQLQQYLKVAMTETLTHLQQLPPGQRRDALAFQLKPEFVDAFDPTTGTLSLTGPLIRYEVETETVEKPLVVQQYLQYADGAAKMNYVLHSGALYPEVRLAVNKALSEQGRLPTKVQLLLDGKAPVQLQATHKFDWTLKSYDQSIIRRCEQARTADETEWVNFRDYQRRVLATTARK